MITLGSGLLATFLSVPSPAHAEQYIATGAAWGSECTNYIIFDSCTMTLIAGTDDGKGNIVALPSAYESVDQYNEGDGKCWLRFQYRSGWLGYLVTRLIGPNFVTKAADGEYQPVRPEFIVFPCVKR